MNKANPSETTENVGKKTLLAGAGALESGRQYASDMLDNLYADGNAFINSLIARGTQLETELQEKLTPQTSVKAKLETLISKLGFQHDIDERLQILSTRVDTLVETVATLTADKAATAAAKEQAAKQKAEREKAAKAAAEKSAAEAAAKKAEGAKSTAAKAKATKKASVSRATAAKRPAAKSTTTTKATTSKRATPATKPKTTSRPAANKPAS
jgi:peptidoglycan hydrolase CwlO-like protein